MCVCVCVCVCVCIFIFHGGEGHDIDNEPLPGTKVEEIIGLYI